MYHFDLAMLRFKPPGKAGARKCTLHVMNSANGLYVAVPNRVGSEGTVEFWGGSFVADPFGALVAQAGHEAEDLLLVRCDLARIEEVRRHWPFLRDRRIDAYRGLGERLLDEP